MVPEFEPLMGLSAANTEPPSDLLSPALCPSPTHVLMCWHVHARALSLSLSQKINKLKNKPHDPLDGHRNTIWKNSTSLLVKTLTKNKRESLQPDRWHLWNSPSWHQTPWRRTKYLPPKTRNKTGRLLSRHLFGIALTILARRTKQKNEKKKNKKPFWLARNTYSSLFTDNISTQKILKNPQNELNWDVFTCHRPAFSNDSDCPTVDLLDENYSVAGMRPLTVFYVSWLTWFRGCLCNYCKIPAKSLLTGCP